jgi:hypothetical protein
LFWFPLTCELVANCDLSQRLLMLCSLEGFSITNKSNEHACNTHTHTHTHTQNNPMSSYYEMDDFNQLFFFLRKFRDLCSLLKMAHSKHVDLTFSFSDFQLHYYSLLGQNIQHFCLVYQIRFNNTMFHQ